MRLHLPTAIALASAQYIFAQESSARDDPTFLSSIVGPFTGPTFIFAPGISAYDFISAVGSTGTNDETTTYKAYASSTMADPENRLNDIPGDMKVGKQAYGTFTLGPTTWEGEGALPYVTPTDAGESGDGAPTIQTINPGPTISPPWYSKVSKRQKTDESRAATVTLEEESQTLTYSGGPMTTMCSYTTEPRKAACTTSETDAMEGATRRSWRTQTLEGERGWVSVYVLLDPTATMSAAEDATAEETGSMTAMTTSGTGRSSGSVAQAPAATSTQAGAAAEVTAWVNAVVVVVAAAAMAM